MWVSGHQILYNKRPCLDMHILLQEVYLYEFWEFFTSHKLLAGGNDCFKMLKYKSNVNLWHECS